VPLHGIRFQGTLLYQICTSPEHSLYQERSSVFYRKTLPTAPQMEVT